MSLTPSTRSFSTTQPRADLMEFFDDPKNYGQREVKHGRAWTKDELRIKSSSDLHKLWYVLLKERNMLLTMEHELWNLYKSFPSPERIDKVKISMDNLEEVVKERNRAYYELELGESRVRDPETVQNELGLDTEYRPQEHLIPKDENEEWKKSRRLVNEDTVRVFLKFYREKLRNEKRKAKNRDNSHVVKLLRRFPNISIDLVKEKYPDVDVDKILRDDRARTNI